jgi:hypothetical protein
MCKHQKLYANYNGYNILSCFILHDFSAKEYFLTLSCLKVIYNVYIAYFVYFVFLCYMVFDIQTSLFWKLTTDKNDDVMVNCY